MDLGRKREEENVVGPIAIIAPEDATFEQACQFVHVTELVRPIRVFREWHEGLRWIDAVVIDRANAADGSAWTGRSISGGGSPKRASPNMREIE